MKAKLVKEYIEFERGQDPKKSLGIGRKIYYKEIIDFFLEFEKDQESVWDKTERFVNDVLLDSLLAKYPVVDIDDLVKAAQEMIKEAIQIWAQTTEYEENES